MMLKRLDPRSDKPIYLQIADSIAAQIDSGSIGPGERLPSARTLGATLDVNMHTVLRAYSDLERRRLVEVRRGRAGVLVSPAVDLREIARELVSAAKRAKLSKAELLPMVEEVWG